MELEVIVSLVSLAAGGVGVWIKSSNDVARLKERITAIEKNEARVEDILTKLAESIQRIERALVKAGYIDVG